MPVKKKNNSLTLALFSLTLFLSAALMFGLQPMIGKMLLPIVGGTPSGWIVAMAFFQVMLLAGYFLAYALARYEARAQGILYILCLGIGIFFLPASLAKHVGVVGDNPMALDVFLLLAVAVAVPFIALSATASTLQRLFTTTGHPSAKDPYFLYAASNLGSFAGLLLYPLLIEPNLTLTAQSQDWLVGYILLIGMGVLCLLMSGNKKAEPKKAVKIYVPIPWKTRLEWMVLAFLPSGLLLAVTTHITTDIFSLPLLWVLPLSIYLLTYVVAFSKKSLVRYDWILHIHPIAAAVTIAFTLLVKGNLAVSWYALSIHLISFAIVALMCHMRLSRARPGDDPRHLTEFYLMIALGGAFGGVLNAFIVPVIFDYLVEYPLMLVASGLLNENIRKNFSTRYVHIFLTGCILVCVVAVLRKQGTISEIEQNVFLITIFALLTLHPRAFVAITSLSFIGATFYIWLNPPLLTERNFYGVIKVYDKVVDVTPDLKAKIRYMQHGTTLHGLQVLHEQYETTPTTYYTREGPLGDVVALVRPKTIAAVGLGTGTVNCYSAPGRDMTFFEIDPAVIKMAQEQFTYLSKCGAGMPRIILGDARLELKKLEDEKFDLIILDAFSSDTVPTHLLTKEAIEVYLERLTPNGIILFHISNRHFTLDGPIAASAKLLGLNNAVVMQNKVADSFAASSRWMALARPEVDLVPLSGTAWVQAVVKDFKPWTDDYTNLLSTLNY